MRYWYLIALAALFCLPLRAVAVDAAAPLITPLPQAAPSGMEEVPEPDEDDMPPGEMPEEQSPAIPPQNAPVVAPAKPVETGDSNFNEVILQGLNKVTARASIIEAPIGSVVRFGTIEIIAHSCWKSAPEERPENAALLEISEVKQGESPTRIYLGWMFSSSPGLSSLEHPFYDVTVIECKNGKL